MAKRWRGFVPHILKEVRIVLYDEQIREGGADMIYRQR